MVQEFSGSELSYSVLHTSTYYQVFFRTNLKKQIKLMIRSIALGIVIKIQSIALVYNGNIVPKVVMKISILVVMKKFLKLKYPGKLLFHSMVIYLTILTN